MKALSLCALIVGIGVLASSALFASSARSRYVSSSRNDYAVRQEALELADKIAEGFAPLAGELYDYETHPVLENLRSEYGGYGITIEDVSSGLHLDFLRDEFLAEIAKYVFASGSAEGFIAERNTLGLVNDVEKWKGQVTAEALPDCVAYGWLQRDEGCAFAYGTIAASHGTGDEYELFPIVNTLPMMNVNNIRGELLKALLAAPSWKVSAAADKAKAIETRKESGPVTEGILRTVLALPANNPAYKYLGVKTTFWRVSYNYKTYKADIIIAAIPEEGSDMIAEYRIAERRLRRDK